MPDPRPQGAGLPRDPAERGFIHGLICDDQEPDERYQRKISNTDKVEFICTALEYPRGAFDLDTPFPQDDWLVSEDVGYLCAGLYLNDLREQFYDLMIEKQPETHGDLFARAGLAEFYKTAFRRVLTRKQAGTLIGDSRTLH